MNTIKAIIVEDEKTSREVLVSCLNRFCPSVNIIAECESVEQSIEAISNLTPDLVFIDLNLGGKSGFEILNHFKKVPFKIIFVTAYSEYAIKAFEYSAIDYLLKPVLPERLISAVHRAQENIENEFYADQIKLLKENLKSSFPGSEKIALKTSEKIFIIDINNITRCESDSSYTLFYTSDGKKIVTSKPLKDYELLFPQDKFFRAHKSYLINLNHVNYFDKNKDILYLTDGSEIPVATRKRDMLIKSFNSIKSA